MKAILKLQSGEVVAEAEVNPDIGAIVLGSRVFTPRGIRRSTRLSLQRSVEMERRSRGIYSRTDRRVPEHAKALGREIQL